ncbi:Leucine efflux protein [Leminorella richardii]|uniref:Leucine efflux protein n=1 Tax=Leminorella richardii TaxID=158841 RepID=A0A2X4USS6_9GAMM|nr:LysE family translocator [Leminorella richardii]SQI41881.1 Leucine efflux protein [Leminorella richardii]
MPDLSQIIAFSLLSLGMALTPGPNMIYLISRSLSQGRAAGLISLIGVALGFLFYLFCAAAGITTLLLAVPYAYDVLRVGGVIYLLYLAWRAVKPGGVSPFQLRELPKDSPKKLFMMGFITNLLNPQIAIMYLSLLPQFITPAHGNVMTQSLILGAIQIAFSITINAAIAISAAYIAKYLTGRPAWIPIQRWIMGGVLAGLAVRMMFEARR